MRNFRIPLVKVAGLTTFQTMIAGEIEKSEIEELMGHTKYRKGYDHRDGERRLKQLQNLRNRLNSII